MKNTFIPNWYIDKKNKTKIKIFKIVIMVVLVFDIILLVCVLNILNKTGKINEKIDSPQKNIGIVTTIKHDVIIEKFNNINNFFKGNNVNYKDITITDNNLEINIEVKDYTEYIKVISCIENKYTIKRLTPNIKVKGKLIFNIILEVQDV